MARFTGGYLDSNAYLLGRGEVWFSNTAAGAVNTIGGLSFPKDNFRFLGNVPELSIANSKEEFEHSLSVSGVSVTDATVITKRTTGPGSMTLEYADPENLAMIFSASVDRVTNDLSVATNFTAIGTWQASGLGRLYYLRNEQGNRIYDLQSTTGLEIRVGSATNVATIHTKMSDITGVWNGYSPIGSTLVDEVVVDLKLGTVYVPGSYTTSTGVPAMGSPVLCRINNAAIGAGAVTAYAETKAFSKTVTGQLLFVSRDARSADGDQRREIYFPSVEITPGDIGLITQDEFAQFPMEFTISSDTTGTPFYVRYPISAKNG